MQKGYIPILIVILIAVLAVGGYFAYSSLRANPAKPASVAISPSPASVSNPTPKPESTSSAVNPAPNGAWETANWKTYTNIKYGTH